MATDVEQNYYGGWPQELSDGDEPQEIPVSQMLDHGSISFGRFTVESLSWERKSVFAHDRRQEELEKFNGLVAKKKAYFEERYRRMRALKAAQQSQQTELILEYGGDGSNSSQSEEEDEKASKHVGPRDEGSANITSTPSEEQVKSEAVFEQESCHSGSHQAHKPDQESSFQGISSSGESFTNVDQDKNYSSISQFEPSKMDSSAQMMENVQVSEADHRNTLGSQKILRKPENLVSSSRPGAVTKVSGLKKESSQVNHGHRSFPKIKDSATGTRRGPELKLETKADVIRPSRGTTNPLRQTFGKVETSPLARGTNVSKANNSTRSSLHASKRPIVGTGTERSNLTTAGAFSAAMQERANFRGSETKQVYGIPNKVLSSLGHVKGGLIVQGASSNKTTTTSIKNTRVESKRASKEDKIKPPSTYNAATGFRRNEPPLVPKSRSVNIPARNKPGSTSGSAFQPRVAKGSNQKGEIEVTKPRELQGPATRPSTRLKGATKSASVQKSQQSNPVRKQLDNLSLDGRKTKGEVPQWR